MFGSVIFLCAIGLAVLFSTTYDPQAKSEAVRQAFYIPLGFLVLVIMSRLDYRMFRSYSGILYIIVIFLLLFLEIAKATGLGIGKEAMGAVRWIDFGFFQFQPSIVAQLLMVVIMAKFFSDNYETMHKFRTIAKSALYVAIPTILVAMQPDLGTAFVFVFSWAALLFFSNAKRIYLAIMGAAGLVGLPFIWLFLKDYQRQRVLTFFNPTADPQGAGWNVTQAMIAIGSGQFWGRGLGHGTQSQLNFIPEKHTDFIFAAMAEEMGFLGVIVLLSLYAVLFWRGIRIAILARDFFGTYLVVGILAILFVHVFVNIGMNMGIMPVTGIPLPFVSYGGTPVIVDLAAIGILESVYMRYKKIDF